MSKNDLDALLGRVSGTDARRDLLQPTGVQLPRHLLTAGRGRVGSGASFPLTEVSRMVPGWTERESTIARSRWRETIAALDRDAYPPQPPSATACPPALTRFVCNRIAMRLRSAKRGIATRWRRSAAEALTIS